jgi:hypothetical protein
MHIITPPPAKPEMVRCFSLFAWKCSLYSIALGYWRRWSCSRG